MIVIPSSFRYRKPMPHGSVLLMVLIAIIIMSLTAGTYLSLMHNEHVATRYRGRREQARLLSESGVRISEGFPQPIRHRNQSAGRALRQSRCYARHPGDRKHLACVSRALHGLGTQSRRGLLLGAHVTVWKTNRPSSTSTCYWKTTIKNRDTARQRLLAIPGIDQQIADAILDWLDEDDDDSRIWCRAILLPRPAH